MHLEQNGWPGAAEPPDSGNFTILQGPFFVPRPPKTPDFTSTKNSSMQSWPPVIPAYLPVLR